MDFSSLFDFLARLGEVTIGAIMAVVLILIVLGLVVELVDFLIVDPINRNKPADEEIIKED